MKIGLDLCAAILQYADLETVVQAGVTPNRFTPDERPVYQAILDHHETYAAFPGRDTLATLLGEDAIDGLPDDVAEPIQFYIDRVNRRALSQVLTQALKTATQRIGSGEPLEALEALESVVTMVRARTPGAGARVVDLVETAPARREAYDRLHADPGALRGLPTPWLSLNRATAGLNPGSFTAIAGRVWSGKSWLLLAMVHELWVNRKLSPLVISMEMPHELIGRRLDGMRAKVPYSDLVSGRLNPDDLDVYHLTMEGTVKLPPIHYAGPPLVRTVQDVKALIREYKPDGGVWIDGINRLRTAGDQDRYRRVAEAADELKFLMEECGIAGVGTTHLTREGGRASKKNREDVELEDFGYSYAITEQADNALGLISMPNVAQRLLKVLKVREESARVAGLFINFDMKVMDFSEVGQWDGDPIEEDHGFGGEKPNY